MSFIKKKLKQFMGSDFNRYHNEALSEEQVGEAGGPDPYFFLRTPNIQDELDRMAYSRGYKRRRYSRRRRGGNRGASFSRRNIGEPVGSSNTKTVTSLFEEDQTRDTRQLVSAPLIAVNSGTGIHQRQRQIINVRGFKFNIEVRNQITAPLYVNMCIIAPKSSTFSGISLNDFFRGYDENRSEDFDFSLNSIQFHYNPINTDRYTVLKHKRIQLIAAGREQEEAQSIRTESGRNYRTLKWYMKLNRQIRFDQSTNQPESGQVYFVWWADYFGADQGDQGVSNAIRVKSRCVLVFRETRN